MLTFYKIDCPDFINVIFLKIEESLYFIEKQSSLLAKNGSHCRLLVKANKLRIG